MNTPTKHPPEFESPELESTAVVSLDSAANASPNPTSTTQAAPDSGSRQIPVWREIPNVAVGLVILSGVLVEGWMLGRVAQPVYSLGISVGLLTGTFLIWFWSTVGLLLHAVARRSLRNEANRPAVTTWAARLGYGLAIAFVTLTYAVSWGLFFQTGRFANLEVAQFMFANTHDLWLYLAQAEPVHLARMAGVVLVVAVATPFFLPWLARTDQPDRSPAIWRNRWWVWSSIACVAAALLVVRDPSYGRRCERFGHLEHSLNPLVTFAVSARQAFFAEPISPVLDESQLRPLATPFPVPPQVKRPSIIIVAIESLRQDVVHLEHQGREITPHINRLARDGLTWNNAYAQSTHSDYADVCIVSSLYPLRTRHHLYYSRNDPWPKTLIYDVLKSAGYETAIISSQNEAWGAMDQFLESPHLDHFYHPQRSTKTHLQVRPTRDPGFNYELE
ncbi:MAG: sulfatase-like hydrolase/transferase, partial [Planctomycetales bacterium]|nr:sulfatase-like hydrolase/transferase [Planctomycetales bacterium]